MENNQETAAREQQEVVSLEPEPTPSIMLGDGHPDELEHDKSGELDDVSETPDFQSFAKKDFVAYIKELTKTDNVKQLDSVLKEIKPLFDELRDRARQEALKRFIEGGGQQDDFEFRADEHDIAFDANYKLIRDKRNAYYKNLEDQKNENLRKKTQLLEQLRTLVDGEDSDTAFRTFKEIQHQWKLIGPVAQAQAKTTWANYNALVDRFYDNRSIYFELKELDRKKNLELKYDLCARAEKINATNLNAAVRELNELHYEFKHIGPVPIEVKEVVWQRFKTASDAIYHKRDEFLAALQADLKINLEKKLAVCEEVASFGTFTSDKIKEWNQKTKEILDLQKKWDTIGAVPRNKAKDVNKNFWSKFKLFFHNKNTFFKKLDEERAQNLKIKQDLIQQAIQLQESSDWEKTARTLKDLQARWKEVGPVPEKVREKIYQEFKKACDHFFEHRRTQFEQQDKEQEQNLILKEAVIAEVISLTAAGTGTRETLQTLQRKFNAIGFVPRKSMDALREKMHEATQKFLSTLPGLTSAEREEASLEATMSELKNDPNAERKIYHKEQSIRKQIQKAENDIAVLRNNLEFFARSKNADLVRQEFNAKIDEATVQLNALKKQLKILQAGG